MAIDNARGGIDVNISRDDTIVKELNIVITPLVGNAFEDNFEEFFLHMRGVKCDCSSKGKAGGAKHTLGGCLFAKSACETCGMTQMQSEKVQMNEFTSSNPRFLGECFSACSQMKSASSAKPQSSSISSAS